MEIDSRHLGLLRFPGAGGKMFRAESKIKMKDKQKTRIGTWNERTPDHGCKEASPKEYERYGVDVLGICEHRLAGEGHFNVDDGGILIYSGRKKSGLSSVAVYLSKNLRNCLLGYNPISDRVMTVRIQSRST